jgi:hypothetical protein
MTYVDNGEIFEAVTTVMLLSQGLFGSGIARISIRTASHYGRA